MYEELMTPALTDAEAVERLRRIVEVLGRGADILAETDLAFAREYAKKYLKKDY